MPARATTGRRSGDGAGAATRERILNAAEALFASEGIDRVTLRQIVRASDQKNVAAVQYHFGSKEGLLEAILETHQREIDDERRQRLADADRNDGAESLPQLLDILVSPLARLLDDPSGRAYLQIQTQRVATEALLPATRDLVRRIAHALGGSAPDALQNRFAVLLLFQALGDRARQEERGEATRRNRNRFVLALTHALHGLYLGPRNGKPGG